MPYLVIRTPDPDALDIVPRTRALADATELVGTAADEAELVQIACAEAKQAALDTECAEVLDALGAHRAHMDATSKFVPPDDDTDGPILSL